MAIRVYQIAKEYSRSSEEVMTILKEAGIEVQSHTSPLDEHALHTVNAKLGKYKLTVVDGDQESAPPAEAGEKPKVVVKKKKKTEEAPKPKLAVRVIKKNEEEEKEAEEQEASPEAKPTLRKPPPKLRKSKRTSIEERIKQAAERRQQEDEAPAAASGESAQTEQAQTEPAREEQAEKPAAAARSEKPHNEQRNQQQPRGEKPLVLNNDRPQSDGRGRGGDRRPPRDDRQNRDGYAANARNDQRGYGGRPGGQRGPGGPGGQRGPGGPGGQRPHGAGGQRGPGGPGGQRGPGGPGGQRPQGGAQRGGQGQPQGQGRGGPPRGRGGSMMTPADLQSLQTATARSGSNRPRFGAGGAQPGKGKRKKRRRKNEENMSKLKMVSTAKKVELPEDDLGIIMLSEGVTVKELAEKVDRKAKDVIKRLFEKGIMATLNDVLDSDLAIDLAKDFGYLAEIVSFEEDLQMQEEETMEGQEVQNTGGTEPRAPIVTIMGHVDHGKTTLLDAIRATRVADDEAGGITQHIGAYAVEKNDQKIVFLDTPGHEAFTKMRARGASVTDIVILVVAADDGVKPQTIEAISHAKAAKVPIITCINKIDKPGANPDRVKQMLTEHELIVEEFGGDSPSVEVSAKQKIGIEDLLEMILIVSELHDYKANPELMARGTVIEARLDRGRGPVATLIVQDGVLSIGDFFITGQTYGKIRAMRDDYGHPIQEGGPSTPVEVQGLQEVPAAGDTFQVVPDEAVARKMASFRKEKAREDSLHRQKHTSLDQLFNSLTKDEVKELPIIIKADVQGSVEGLVFALNKIESDKVTLRIVHQGVGNITENDILLAVASDAIVIGFNVKSEPKAQALADHEGIETHIHSIIYEVVTRIERAMLGLVAPTLEERYLGRAVVKQVFNVAKLGKVAGCFVEDGMIKRDAQVRVLRGENQIYEGELQTLKRFKDDVNEVKNGYECGVGIAGYADLEEGDQLNFFTMEEVEATEL